MALAYTAPTWEDGSGTGISASQLQALCNCVEGLVQGTDKAVHNITFSGSTMTLTFADGSQETAATSVKGVSSITKTGSSQTDPVVDTYTITYSDGTTSSFQITNGAKGDTGATPVITVSATADAIASLNPTVNVTKSGTDEAPHFSMAFSGLKGQTGEQGNDGADGQDGVGITSVTKTATSGNVDTYTILLTNGDRYTFTVTNGTGSGDMRTSVYDDDDSVANAGGIADYVDLNAMARDGSNASALVNISGSKTLIVGTKKQNGTIGNKSIAAGTNFEVGDYSVSVGYGTAAKGYCSSAFGEETNAGYSHQLVAGAYNNNKLDTLMEVGNGSSGSPSNAFEVYANGDINFSGKMLNYLENDSVVLSTSATTSVTFTDSRITSDSYIEYACSQWDLVPESITATTGSCTIVLPKVDAATTVGVRIYVR